MQSNRAGRWWHLLVVGSVLTLGAVVGCGDDDDVASSAGAGGGPGQPAAGAAGASGGAGGVGGAGGASTAGAGGVGGAGGASTAGAGGGAGRAPETFVAFDATKGQLVEGLSVRGGKAYVGALPLGIVYEVDLASKAVREFGRTPTIAPNEGAMLGLGVDDDGTVYAGVTSQNPAALAPGVYRFAPGGGAGALFASDAGLGFPNDVRVEASRLLVTDSLGGRVYAIDKATGQTTVWLESPLLTPDPTVCNVATAFHLGANGITRRGGAYYITNTDRGMVVRVPVVGTTEASGPPEVFVATDCEHLAGVDGLVAGPDEALWIAVNFKNALVRVRPDGTFDTVAQGAPLSSPAGLALDGGQLYITAAAFEKSADLASARPALLSLRL